MKGLMDITFAINYIFAYKHDKYGKSTGNGKCTRGHYHQNK